MTISEIMQKMIIYSKGNLHDINHFLKVWSFAKTIGEAKNDAHVVIFDYKSGGWQPPIPPIRMVAKK